MSKKLNRPNIRAIRNSLEDVNWDFPDFYPSSDTKDIHSLHWYPAVFPPILASMLIDILSKKESVILDPFSGSGVTAIEAWMLGRHSIGYDIFPFSEKLSKAKISLISHANDEDQNKILVEIKQHYDILLKKFKRENLIDILNEGKIHADATNWFNPITLLSIACLKMAIIALKSSNWKNVLEIILSSILHPNLSIVKKYHHSYIVDRSKVKNPCYDPIDASQIYESAVIRAFSEGNSLRMQMIDNKNLDALKVPPEIKLHDCREPYCTIKNGIDIIVTSPPYFGMSDYVRSQYLSWLIFQWDGYESFIKNEIGSRRKRNSQKAYDEYIKSMISAFNSMYLSLKRGGLLSLTIGQSSTKIARMNNPLETLYQSLTSIGFDPIWRQTRRVKFRKQNNMPYRTEELWILKK